MNNPTLDDPNRPSHNDFVFIDDCSNPYRVRESSDGHWMYYYNEGSKSWVSLRKVTIEERQQMFDLALPQDKANLYEAGVKFI